MTKPYILAIFNCCWADEFNVEGFRVYSKEDWEIQKKILSEPMDWYFGTNEGWEQEIFLHAIHTQEISEETYNTLLLLFPSLEIKTLSYDWKGTKKTFQDGGDFGHFPHFSPEDIKELEKEK